MRSRVASTSFDDGGRSGTLEVLGRNAWGVSCLIGSSTRSGGFAVQAQRNTTTASQKHFASLFDLAAGAGQRRGTCLRPLSTRSLSQRIEERDQLVLLRCAQTAIVIDHECRFARMTQNRFIARK